MESLGQMEKLVGTTRRVLCMLGALSFALSCGSCSTKNKPSENKAANFDYTLPDGSTHKLSALHSEYVILYFHNPECRECATVKEKLVSSPILNTLQQKGQLKILALYPDEDLKACRQHLPEMPAEWINAYDKGTIIKNRELYDLKAIPTLYLLDKDKTVLLKDAPFESLEAYLAQKHRQ